jgi:hypothetical protein
METPDDSFLEALAFDGEIDDDYTSLLLSRIGTAHPPPAKFVSSFSTTCVQNGWNRFL